MEKTNIRKFIESYCVADTPTELLENLLLQAIEKDTPPEPRKQEQAVPEGEEDDIYDAVRSFRDSHPEPPSVKEADPGEETIEQFKERIAKHLRWAVRHPSDLDNAVFDIMGDIKEYYPLKSNSSGRLQGDEGKFTREQMKIRSFIEKWVALGEISFEGKFSNSHDVASEELLSSLKNELIDTLSGFAEWIDFNCVTDPQTGWRVKGQLMTYSDLALKYLAQHTLSSQGPDTTNLLPSDQWNSLTPEFKKKWMSYLEDNKGRVGVI